MEMLSPTRGAVQSLVGWWVVECCVYRVRSGNGGNGRAAAAAAGHLQGVCSLLEASGVPLLLAPKLLVLRLVRHKTTLHGCMRHH